MSKVRIWDEDTIIPPSSMLVFWPGDTPPMAEEIRLRLGDWGQATLSEEGSCPEETLWSFWLELVGEPTSCLIWCEQISGPHLRLLDQVRWHSPDQEREARMSRWVVGIEGPLSLREPTADYQRQLRLCDAISCEWSPVIFDASATVFRTPQEIRSLIRTATAPRVQALYALHKLANRRTGDERTYWLHTHGLERAGIPDLEIFGVPERLVGPACELIEAVAGLWIGQGTPQPQTPFAVGDGLELAWRPWQAPVAEMDPQAVGGANCRREAEEHAGFRAVLVASQPQGWMRKRWVPPLESLEQLTRPNTTLFKTVSETRRLASMARERWGTFGLLFASKHPIDWRFVVKVSFPSGLVNQPAEHLWFDVEAIRPGRILARLASKPAFQVGLTVGDSYWVELERLTDWRIVTPEQVFDPESADTLLDDDAPARSLPHSTPAAS